MEKLKMVAALAWANGGVQAKNGTRNR